MVKSFALFLANIFMKNMNEEIAMNFDDFTFFW